MQSTPLLSRLLLVLGLALSSSCATSQSGVADSLSQSAEPQAVRATRLPGEHLQLDFEPVPLDPTLETVTVEEVRSVLADFLQCVEDTSQFQVLPVLASSTRRLAPWEARLRAEFLARYGPGLLPLPDSLERSPLFMALRLSPQKKDGYQWHHLATDKNDSSALRGGPWTPRFQRLFAKAGMNLNDPANRIYLLGHLGPHPERYHTEVHRRLETALEDCGGTSQCRMRLMEELQRIRDEVCTRGSPLHRLLTES